MTSQDTITISRLTSRHFDELRRLRVRPEQEEFAVPDAQALAQQLKSSELPFVMLKNTHLVGFFFVDLDYSKNHDFCSQQGAGVRMVMVDQAFQGQGIAARCLMQLPRWLQQHYPDIKELYLTVNCRNPRALRCYEKCNYLNTGELYLGGPVGPQYIMRSEISESS